MKLTWLDPRGVRHAMKPVSTYGVPFCEQKWFQPICDEVLSPGRSIHDTLVSRAGHAVTCVNCATRKP